MADCPAGCCPLLSAQSQVPSHHIGPLPGGSEPPGARRGLSWCCCGLDTDQGGAPGLSYGSGRWGGSNWPHLSNRQRPSWVKGSPPVCFPPPQGEVIFCWTLHREGCLLPLCTSPRADPGAGSSPSGCRSRAEGWSHSSPPAKSPKSVLPALKFRNSSWRPQLVNNPLPRGCFFPPHFFPCTSLLCLPSPTWRGNWVGEGIRSPYTLSPLLCLWVLTPQQAECCKGGV